MLSRTQGNVKTKLGIFTFTRTPRMKRVLNRVSYSTAGRNMQKRFFVGLRKMMKLKKKQWSAFEISPLVEVPNTYRTEGAMVVTTEAALVTH